MNDRCVELVDAYAAIRADAENVVLYAEKLSLDKETYYKVRQNRSTELIERAGEFIYLNRGCFNGLYRVNSKGEFNVPWGAPKTSFIVDQANVLECQRVLNQGKTVITSIDFELALKGARAGDLIFLDPPYVTKHNNNGFVDYNERLFSWQDQVRLAAVAEKLRLRGCHVIVTNAYHADVLALYPEFSNHILRRSSTLAGASAKRGTVQEAILVGRK